MALSVLDPCCCVWHWVRACHCKPTHLILLQRDNLKLAQNYYQLVGNAASECGEEGGRGQMSM